MKLGTENRKQTILAAVLGALLLLVMVWQFWPSSSTSASTAGTAEEPPTPAPASAHPAARVSAKAAAAKKERIPQNLDPTLHLDLLAVTEQIKYEGSGRNIFVAQSEAEIPRPLAPGQTDPSAPPPTIYTAPPTPTAPPIPLKFFGFANRAGEPKKVFLSNKGEDVFIAGEGEIIDRRYKVVKISATSVEIQDVVSSGPPQTIPLTQGGAAQ